MNGAEFLHKARSAGLLSPEATWPQGQTRPWPVLVLTALGAWLAVIPLLLLVGALFGRWVDEGPTLFVLGSAALALAVVLLRSPGLPLFVEQLAVPVLLVGLLCLGWGLHRELSERWVWGLIALLQLLLAAFLSPAWLRKLLGAGAAALFLLAWQPRFWGPEASFWLPTLALTALLGLAWWERWPARWALWADAVGAGWFLVLAVALALQSGMSFLVGGVMDAGGSWSAGWHSPWQREGLWALPLVLLAGGLLARRWPGLRSAQGAGAVLLLAALAWVLPALGPLALLAALALRQQRGRLAVAAGVAALWVLGSFYYRLDWALQHKALGLVGLGALTALLVRWQRGGAQPRSEGAGALARPWGLGLSLAAGLLLVNAGIVLKERLIQQGQPVFVELAPVDPRSLMQGDFMRLDYALLRLATVPEPGPQTGAQRPMLVLARDARGVAQWRRLHREGEALADDELRVELSPKAGRWTLVSDAWFFKEGEAARWEAARYAEFRVDASGRALLVGLRGADLRPL
ncbi:putative membrane-anchored protein [Inhella inkyongensis]|uniref:Putative membrane-anchored protein n=1 Tax=Inhella inkyongensis TaxID=392593 RepID=A0A840S824_9BURK|nr:GDYXXLXY domain-containing protein [Inhella inkyongensis]MBB5205823.1 putative membrane-anchored protein [Inhella inkyongensis]